MVFGLGKKPAPRRRAAPKSADERMKGEALRFIRQMKTEDPDTYAAIMRERAFALLGAPMPTGEQPKSEIRKVAETVKELQDAGLLPKGKPVEARNDTALLDFAKLVAPMVPDVLAAFGALRSTAPVPPQAALPTAQPTPRAEAPAAPPPVATSEPAAAEPTDDELQEVAEETTPDPAAPQAPRLSLPSFADAWFAKGLARRNPKEAVDWLVEQSGRIGEAYAITDALHRLPDAQLAPYLDQVAVSLPKTVAWIKAHPDWFAAAVADLRTRELPAQFPRTA